MERTSFLLCLSAAHPFVYCNYSSLKQVEVIWCQSRMRLGCASILDVKFAKHLKNSQELDLELAMNEHVVSSLMDFLLSHPLATCIGWRCFLVLSLGLRCANCADLLQIHLF